VSVVVAIDAGTTGVRALAVSESGTVTDSRYREFTQHFPQPGWVEHDADEIWEAVQGTLGDLAASLTDPIAAIGITNPR
jgi:glycerol kinase